jgi:hypothetical protein
VPEHPTDQTADRSSTRLCQCNLCTESLAAGPQMFLFVGCHIWKRGAKYGILGLPPARIQERPHRLGLVELGIFSNCQVGHCIAQAVVFAEEGGVHAREHSVLVDAGIARDKHVLGVCGAPCGDRHEVAHARAHLAAHLIAQHILHSWSLLLVHRLGSGGLHIQMRRCIYSHKGWLCYVLPGGLPHEDQTGRARISAHLLQYSAYSIPVTGSRQRQQADCWQLHARSCQLHTCTSGELSHLEVAGVMSVDHAAVDERCTERQRRPTLRLASLRFDKQPCEEHLVRGRLASGLDGDGELRCHGVGRGNEVVIHKLAKRPDMVRPLNCAQNGAAAARESGREHITNLLDTRRCEVKGCVGTAAQVLQVSQRDRVGRKRDFGGCIELGLPGRGEGRGCLQYGSCHLDTSSSCISCVTTSHGHEHALPLFRVEQVLRDYTPCALVPLLHILGYNCAIS